LVEEVPRALTASRGQAIPDRGPGSVTGPRGTVPAAVLMAVPVVTGIAAAVIVEGLAVLSFLGSRVAWSLAWGLGLLLCAFTLRRLRRPLESTPDSRLPLPGKGTLWVVGIVLLLTFVVALAAPPNNFDALVYHDARVMQWWDHGNLTFWYTPIERQLQMPPFASYLKLGLYGLMQSDLLFSLVQWLFFAYCIFGAWTLGESLAPGRRAGALAALLVATMPMAILQSTSTQNDLVCGGYVVAAAYFALRILRGDAPKAVVDVVLLGGATGLAWLTKGTAFVLASPLLILGVAVASWRACRQPGRIRISPLAGIAAGLLLALLLNLPHTARVVRAFGSPLNRPEAVSVSVYFRSGVGNGVTLAVSQLARNGFLQLGQLRLLGVRSGRLFDAVTAFHDRLGVRVDDPRISLRPSRFADARWQTPNHEDTAASTFHFLLALAAPGLLLSHRLFAGGLRRSLVVAFAAGWTLWGLLCMTMMWMPWNQRLQLPALVLLMVPTAAACAAMRPVARLISVAVAVVSLPYLLLNLSRPLVSFRPTSIGARWEGFWTGGQPKEIRSVLSMPRWDNYFRNADPLRESVESGMGILGAGCPKGSVVALVTRGNFPEYLLWAGARHAGLDLRFRHVSGQPKDVMPCAIIRGSAKAIEVHLETRPGTLP
jgi:hypothetical protein